VVPVIFHNLQGYDLHLFVNALAKIAKDFFVIPKSKEKYLTLTITMENTRIKLKFIDSLNFFGGSLEENAKRLKNMKYVSSAELTSKQVFPYSFFNSIDKLQEQFPFNEDEWYNDLKKCQTSRKDIEWCVNFFYFFFDFNICLIFTNVYFLKIKVNFVIGFNLRFFIIAKHLLKFCNTHFFRAYYIYTKFLCENMGDYTKLYVKSDVDLLASVFEDFRDFSMLTYGLDPAGFYTTPGFAWNAALKMGNTQLELLKLVHIVYIFFKIKLKRRGSN